MEKIKIILDCDPGHDDAIAILLAAHHPAIDLLGITTVAGNQTLDKTSVNALHVCEYLGIEGVPVYSGMSLPMVREQIVAANIHGKSGLDGPIFKPLHTSLEKQHAVNYIIDTLMASDGDIVLVPTGPLTNVAMAMRLEPRIIPKIKKIVLMGGAVGVGNYSPAAEFNILVDPEAAKIVFESGADITMMGLDLTNRTACTREIIDRMEATGTCAGKLLADVMNFTLKTQHDAYGLEGGPVHDVTCIAYLVAPELFTTQKMNVQVEISRGPSYGRTVCDIYDSLHLPHNCTVGLDLDVPKFWDLIEEAVRSYPPYVA